MGDVNKALGKSFDDMFGEAQEFVPNPADIVEGDFDALDEEDAGGEDELDDIDCTDIIAASDAIFELDDEDDDEDEDDDDEYDEDDYNEVANFGFDAEEGLGEDTSLVGQK